VQCAHSFSFVFWKVAQFATLGRKGLGILRKCQGCEINATISFWHCKFGQTYVHLVWVTVEYFWWPKSMVTFKIGEKQIASNENLAISYMAYYNLLKSFTSSHYGGIKLQSSKTLPIVT
jgi:hypothetical protein